ncbi:SpvB/TcaC N-terminal domain-containing protein [Serratia marcescens]|uniref:SpvB/TcaC N-terminal domain-containing protein n=1 Tax=Serratia marcescens TaxID=615 RepID=UPI001BD5BA1C|nr:SpvB/TcaC N-terminal domain-containing protein [Serratia marcescens]EIG9090714.1 virulence protein [Serratia marcescens]CAI1993692.1 Mono(ADP-ribosyl)transferase SpvB [Serratia marcescens]
MPENDFLQLTPPTLPSGGGSISGLRSEAGSAGPDGAATLSIPLPVSAGRGYAPSLSLNYHSRAGNGPLGMGWSLSLPAVRLRTAKGIPAFDGTDEYTGPDGEVLVPLPGTGGKPDIRTAGTLLGSDSAALYHVHAYRPRVEKDFSRLERWVSESDSTDFWVMYSPDGQVHLLGRHAGARICSAQNPAHTAVWLMEASVSASGEQILYQYRAEGEDGCSADETAFHPAATTQRYLSAVWYGNKKASLSLPDMTTAPAAADWLFALVFDYGERQAVKEAPPDWLAPGTGNRPCRPDAFSSREYGFELRTRRLCRQILMYHDTDALAGKEDGGTPRLVAGLQLTYQETPSVSVLKAVQQIAREADGTLLTLPPLELSWQSFSPPPEKGEWQVREDLGNFAPQQPYQLVDLNGEGIAGILYQDAGAWWYRAPVRDAQGGQDAVTWAAPSPLPAHPALRDGGLLTDLNADGYLEWVVTAPGVAGRYERTAGREWQRFAPLSALPVEYRHSRMLMADVSGAGRPDLVLIGPKSLRLYNGDGDGWTTVRNVMQSAGVVLPVPGTDARVMVAFSDMAGSGQQHLVEVRACGVRYWPNAGHGQFDAPVSMPGFSLPAQTFSPQQLFLADVDGSGTTDLIYAESNCLRVWRNQSGNCFAEPFQITLPAGVRYDNTCLLQVADIQGSGMASLVLTVTHPSLCHWVCHLSTLKPWLLSGTDNNMGAVHRLHYRSSAQFWLDEKADAVAAGRKAPVCYLPFALHTLSCTEVIDDITQNRMASTARYRHGVWDSREREFRGFGMVEVSDSDGQPPHADSDVVSMPAVVRSWYATGCPVVDAQLKAEYWQGDCEAYAAFSPQFTQGCAEQEKPCRADDETAFWLNRGLKGIMLRSELYGQDGTDQAAVPYTVTEYGAQVRLVDEHGPCPVVWPSVTESRQYTYERISNDPQCSQQITLSSDAYGHPLRTATLHYPRRRPPETTPYPDTFPDTLFHSSYDAQQQVLTLSVTQHRWHTIKEDNGIGFTGLQDASRTDIFRHPGADIPAAGLTAAELKNNAATWLPAAECGHFAGQQQVWYLDEEARATTIRPAFPPRVAFTETAVLDDALVAALSQDISPAQLAQAGYHQAESLFRADGENAAKLWTVRQGYTTYGSAAHFWLPVAQRATLLTGEVSVIRDKYDCVITEVRDAAGLTTTAEYDWRFLVPVRITDANDNVHACTLDAFGRVTSVRFRGTEDGRPAGYSDAVFSLPADADAALKKTDRPLPVSQCIIYAAGSWQRDRQPPHVVTLTTDRYDSDADQQVRQQVSFNDGFGRMLQVAIRHEAGPAWQRSDEGALKTGPDKTLLSVHTDFRWAVSGRTEYDNKGQPVRTYQPYFLDSWRYVSDDSARQDLYADTYSYDAVGREVQVLTAKGYRRRVHYTPWCVVSDDENDMHEETVRVQAGGTDEEKP